MKWCWRPWLRARLWRLLLGWRAVLARRPLRARWLMLVWRLALPPPDVPVRLRRLDVPLSAVPRAREPRLALRELVSPRPWRQLSRRPPLRSRAFARSGRRMG
jgi:hypothetical protein